MPSDREQIVLIKTQTLTRIAEITENPKPTYQIDGQLVVWGDYLNQLRGTVEWCNAQLAAETPIEVQSRGIT
ncbi:MAG: hypothetical protein JXB10_20705 [Pirellulales bacterium]|nr:hypothetical protein [Pirellulales bacterium]